MRRLATLTAAAALALAVGFTGTAQAQLTKFTDETAFVDATGAVMIGIPDSDTAFPATSCGETNEPTGLGTSLTIAFDSNDLTVTQDPTTGGLCIFDPGFVPSTTNTDPNIFTVPLLVGNGEDDYKIVFDTPVVAIGFLLLTNSSSAEIVTLKDAGDAVIDSAQDISADTPNNGRQFIGFISTTPIKTVIFDTTGGAVQNEGFEGFKAATRILRKAITSGPDLDSMDGIDIAIQINQTTTTLYDFTITYIPGESDPDNVVIIDTVPAEWDVTFIDDELVPDTNDAPQKGPSQNSGVGLGCGRSVSGFGDDDNVDLERGGKVGKKCSSSTSISWDLTPSSDSQTVKVDVTTRQSPSGKLRFKPTSCGKLTLNDGAQAFEANADGTLVLNGGNPIPVGDPSNSLMLVAVDDLDGTSGLVGDGSGDEDQDGLTDADEAFNVGTNPCDPDTDGDGFLDGADVCPLIFGTATDSDNDGTLDGAEPNSAAICDPNVP